MNKFNIGQRVVTDFGIGDIITVNENEYKVFIEFPYASCGPYENWMKEDNIRYAFDLSNDYKGAFIDEKPKPPSKPKQRKQKTKYSHGTFKTVWR